MFRIIRLLFGAILIGLITGLSACGTNPITATPIAPTPTLAVPLSASPTPTATPAADAPITLTVWLPAAFDENPGREMLSQQLATFAASADGAPNRVLIKNDHGPGGLLDLLRSASPVAPGILPDVIALDTTDLEAAASTGLIQPIDPLLPTDLRDDLFPFARDLGTLNGKLYGLIVSADLEHLAINTKIIATAPAQWAEILTATRPLVYVLPLHDSASGVSDAVLAHYFAFGGKVIDADGKPALDQAALGRLLDLYQQAQHKSILPADVLDLNSPTEVWDTFRSSGAAMGNVQASYYLSVAQSLPSIQFALLPALDQPVPPIARGWALALVTRDPHRQAIAMRLMQHLLSPANNGAWTQAAATLPGRVSSLTQWDQGDPYTGFIRDQLTRAQAAPSTAITNVVGPALRKAIDDVLLGRATPEEAAQLAVTSVGTNKK